MNSKEAFSKIYYAISTTDNYVPRNYISIGGFWTVDTWQKNEVTVRLTDEGWTRIILVQDRLHVHEDGNNVLTFYNGTEQDLVKLAEEIS